MHLNSHEETTHSEKKSINEGTIESLLNYECEEEDDGKDWET